jgi:hypothetical protein
MRSSVAASARAAAAASPRGPVSARAHARAPRPALGPRASRTSATCRAHGSRGFLGGASDRPGGNRERVAAALYRPRHVSAGHRARRARALLDLCVRGPRAREPRAWRASMRARIACEAGPKGGRPATVVTARAAACARCAVRWCGPCVRATRGQPPRARALALLPGEVKLGKISKNIVIINPNDIGVPDGPSSSRSQGNDQR